MLVHLRSSTSNLRANAERGRLSEDKLQVSDELNASQYGKTFPSSSWSSSIKVKMESFIWQLTCCHVEIVLFEPAKRRFH